MTNEEKVLLSRMKKGKFNGPIGEIKILSNGDEMCLAVVEGIPTKVYSGPVKKDFDNTNNPKVIGRKCAIEKWETVEARLMFLKLYGNLFDDEKVREYSARYKEQSS